MSTYRTFAPYSTSSSANLLSMFQSFGQAMLNFGWVAQTGHGEVVASSVAGVWTWTTTPIVPTAATTTPRANVNFRGAFSTANTYVLNDTVTSSGLTFIAMGSTAVLTLTAAAISGTTVTYTGTITGGGSNAFVGHSFTIAGFTNSGNNGTFVITASTTTTLVCTNASGVNETHAGTATDVTVPASNIGATTWQPFMTETFLSNGAMTSALPIYIRFVYGNTNSAIPVLYVSVGTGVDSSGNVTGGSSIGITSPTSIGTWTFGGSGNTSSFFSMDFSGDADNFRMAPWRNLVAIGAVGASAGGPPVLVVDRAKTTTGADADGFVYVGWLGGTTSSTTNIQGGIILKSTIGTITSAIPATQKAWVGVPSTPSSTSLGNWGSSPVMPIIPLVGYAANPCLGAVAVQAQDWQNGAVIPAWMYGAVHNFMVVGSDTTLTSYRQINGSVDSAVPAIRWE